MTTKYQRITKKIFEWNMFRNKQLGHDPNSANRRQDFQALESLLERFGNPHTKFPSIHIAGTNGKGSVSTKVAAALQHRGIRVGLYTSPHIESFCERIRVQNSLISE